MVDPDGFRELLAKLEQIDPLEEPDEYEHVVKHCAEQVQGTSSINLRLTRLTSNGAEALVKVFHWADVSSLKELDLSRNFITSSVVTSLSRSLRSGRFTALESLDLSRNGECQMGMDESKTLAEAIGNGDLSNIRTLGLPSCHVPTIATALLKGNLILQELHLQFNRKLVQSSFELRNFFEKGNLSDIRLLNVRDCLITEEQMEYLSKVIVSGEIPNLEHLNLGYNMLGRGGCMSLSKGIRSGHLSKLKHLDLNSCQMRDSGARQIFDSINKMPSLEFLSLKNNAITDVGVTALAQVLRAKSLLKVREIRLSGKTMITNEGIVALAKAMGEPGNVPNLHTLDLGSQKTLEFIGARAVANAYRQNPQLTAFVEVRWPSESLKIRSDEQRKTNKRAEAIQLDLKDEEEVDQTTAKVFLCGYAGMGKTTLRKSLERNRLKSVVKWERTPWITKEAHTRGIELSHVIAEASSGKTVELVLWDLAGQDDVMHGAFSADHGLASGRATTFVLVFSADASSQSSNSLTDRKLQFWLRLIASGAVKGVKRYLVLVLNCMESRKHGGPKSVNFETHIKHWRGLLKKYHAEFSDMINICEEPFAVDARQRTSVQELKQHLLDYVGKTLEGVKIPKICLDIQAFLRDWVEHNRQFPLLSWDSFSQVIKKAMHIDETKLDAAAAHLQELGEIIYHKDFSVDGTVVSDGHGFVVADMEWFCKKVVGQLLLPEKKEEESSLKQQVESDGSLPIVQFLDHVGERRDELIDMLERLGICYKVGSDKVFIPALIAKDDLSQWEGKGVNWVMGRSLAPKADGKAAIPSSLFRRLQVLLAKDPNFGLRGDSEYCARKSCSTFKVGSLIVLVEFNVDPSDPCDDRIDVLVKHSVGFNESDSTAGDIQPAELILQIMALAERLCVQTCPGVEFDRMIIQPWNAYESTVKMAHRVLLRVDELKMRVQQNGLGRNTTYLVGVPPNEKHVREDELLSLSELDAIHSSIQQRLQIAEADIIHFELLPPTFDHREEDVAALVESNTRDSSVFDVCDRLVSVIREEGQKTRDHIDKKMVELHEKFDSAFEEQNRLLHRILCLHQCSIQKADRSVPRYVFLASCKEPHKWVSAKDAFKEKVYNRYRLHMLCESYCGGGNFTFPHEVHGQKGFDVDLTPEWLAKLAPWLVWSLKITIVVMQIGGGFVAPFLSLFLNGFTQSGGDASRIAEQIEKTAVATRAALNKDDPTSPSRTVKEVSEAVVNKLIGKHGLDEFQSLSNLHRVCLRPKDPSTKHQASVVWVCQPCYDYYKNSSRVINDTTR